MATYSTIAELKFKADAADLIAAAKAYDALVAKSKAFAQTTAQTTAAQNATSNSTKTATSAADKFIEKLKQMEAQSGKTKLEILQLKAAQLGVTAAAGPMIQRMQDAADKAEKWQKATDAAKTAGGYLAATFLAVAAGAVAVGKSTIDGLDALNDFADATGTTIENASALEDVAKRTGAEFGDVEKAIIKLNGALKDTNGADDTAKALKAIGLNANELKKEDPAEAMRLIAVALDGFADNADKARVIQELFGKSVKEVSPFLHDLAEKTKLVGNVTPETTKQAETFNKALFEMKKHSEDAARSLMNKLLPAMNAILERMNKGGFMSAIDEFGEQAFGWTSNALSKGVANAQADLEKAKAGRSMELAYSGNTTQMDAAIVAAQQKLRDAEKAFMKYRDRDAGSMAVTPDDSKPSADSSVLAKKDAKGPAEKKERDPFAELMQKIREGTSGSNAAITSGEEQNAAEKERIKLYEDLAAGKMKINDAQKKELEAALSLWDLSIREEKSTKATAEAEKKHAEEQIKLEKERGEVSKKFVEQYDEMFNQMQAEIDNRGKSTREIKLQADLHKIDLDLQKELNELLEKKASLEEQGAARTRAQSRKDKRVGFEDTYNKQDGDWFGGLVDGVKDYADVTKRTFDQMKEIGSRTAGTIESAFTNAAKTGKLNMKDMARSIIADIGAIATKMAITGLVKLLIGGLSGSGGGEGGVQFLNSSGSNYSQMRASGGQVNAGESYMVGEQGPEMVTFGASGSVRAAHRGGAGGAANINAPVNITIQGSANEDSIAKIKQAIAENNQMLVNQMDGKVRQGIIAEQRPRGLLAR